MNTNTDRGSAIASSARMSIAWRFAIGGLAGVTLLAACGDDESSDPSGATPAAAESPSTDAPSTDAPSADAPSTGGDDDPYGPAPTETTTPSGDAAAGADVATGETDVGPVLVNAMGLTLYAFMKDTEGEPTCVDDCAATWPPAIVDGEPDVGDLDASLFTVVEHPEGSQLKAGDRPLYTFAGDAAPGDVNGQGVGGFWFAVAPDGSPTEE